MSEWPIYLFMDVDRVLLRESRTPLTPFPGDGLLPHEKKSVLINSPSLSRAFYGAGLKDVLLGSVDLKTHIEAVIAETNSTNTVEDVFNSLMPGIEDVDQILLEKIGLLRASGLARSFLATNQEKYRLDHLWEQLSFKNYFEEKFCSAEIVSFKDAPEFYASIHSQLGIDPHADEILFFDDTLSNVQAAQRMGWDSYLYRTPDDFIKNPKIAGMLEAANLAALTKSELSPK